MEIVQDDGEVFFDVLVGIVDDGSYDAFDVVFGAGVVFQGGPGLAPKGRENLGDGGDQVAGETAEVLVEAVEGVPANGEVVLVGPIDEEGGLAVAGGGSDEEELVVEEVVQEAVKAGARQEVVPAAGEDNFCAGNRDRHWMGALTSDRGLKHQAAAWVLYAMSITQKGLGLEKLSAQFCQFFSIFSVFYREGWEKVD